MSKDLFYSPTDKKVFEVVGYSSMDNTNNVKEQMCYLQNNYNHFSRIFGTKDIKTLVVDDSRKYKRMRVFYAENIEPENAPKDAYVLNEDWTMMKWLNN